jgi:polyhydroxyalkanoate synthesis regulator phasin
MIRKKPIAWHQECLENMREYLKELQQRLAQQQVQQQSTIDYLAGNIGRLERQVAEAIKCKMDSFDSERFLVKRK